MTTDRIAIVIAFILALGTALAALGLLLLDRQDTGGDAQEEAPDAFAAAIADHEALEGFFTVYTNADKAAVLMRLPAPDAETRVSARAIHLSYLRSGLGSNPVGLDRGWGGNPVVVRFEVRGETVFMVAENTRFTAESENAKERLATEESFARSTLWATPVKATHDDGSVLIDLSDLLTSDTLNVARHLQRRGQGAFSLDPMRSTVNPDASLVFPDNVELEAHLTFASNEPGGEVQATAPVPEAVTLTLHHSFVRLPDDGYTPRKADPRTGAIALPVADYAADLDAPIDQRFALRHRLEKTDPSAERSPVKEPIVFYVDPGAPEQVRSALIDGARWWAEAFEEAGFKDAYQVEELPEGVHPLDARYNVIQWVHRQTRGWSYGNPIYDPRTGEIIKAVITLGSLRVRQDKRIFEGLTDTSSAPGDPDDPLTLSLARLRQLSAHEVGHGLGFVHNFAASTYDGRASVMDYPAPLVRVRDDDTLDFSQAYDVGIGSWDKLTVRYLYSQFAPDTDEEAALEAIAREAVREHTFISDAHARPLGGAHPAGSLWDNGSDPVAALEEAMAVRSLALADFGLANLPDGQPVAALKDIIVPVYLYHRYQIDAAAKVLGGMTFTYAVEGDGTAGTAPVPGAEQRLALTTLLRTLEPGFLALPEETAALLQPGNRSWFDGTYSREEFRSNAFPAFDELQAASVAAGLTIDAILDEQRLTRLYQAKALDPGLPSLDDVFNQLTEQVFRAERGEPARYSQIREAVIGRFLARMTLLGRSAHPAIATRVEARIEELIERLDNLSDGVPPDEDLTLIRLRTALAQIRHMDDAPTPDMPRTPPGSPIGLEAYRLLHGAHCDTCWFCEHPH